MSRSTIVCKMSTMVYLFIKDLHEQGELRWSTDTYRNILDDIGISKDRCRYTLCRLNRIFCPYISNCSCLNHESKLNEEYF